MKFSSRFSTGDNVWVDCSAGYHSLVQYSSQDVSARLRQQMVFHDKSVLIGVSLIHTPISESNFSVEMVKDKNVFHVGHLMGHIGCSAWASEQISGRRVTAATEAEGLYYANKAYLKRLNSVIKGKQKQSRDIQNLLPSELLGLQTDVNALLDLKKSIEESLKTRPPISRKKVFRRESKWNIGDTIWTTNMAGHVFGTCGNGEGGWHSCADRFSISDFEVFDTIYKVLTDNVIKITVGSIRTWDCSGPEFLYKDKNSEQYGHEHHEKLCFSTQLEAVEFFKQFVFINRQKVSRHYVLTKYSGIIDTLLVGELTPKNRSLLKSYRNKFEALKLQHA